MRLTDEECIEILESPKDKFLEKAVNHEQKVRLHTEVTLEETQNPAYNSFLRGVMELIPDDAYSRFKSLIKWPFVTVDYTSGVFSGFQRVFEAPDRYVNVSFTNPDYDNEFDSYKKSVSDWLINSGVNTLKTKFNSYLVVDVPSAQKSSRPNPYFYVLPCGNVEKVKINRDNECEYIAFDTGETFGKDKDKLIAFFDDEYYRIFILKNSKYSLHVDERGENKFFHNTGSCPAHPFWNDVLDSTVTMLDKKMPATESVGRLETLAFKMLSKEYSDLYNLYPLLWTLPSEEDEEFVDGDVLSGDECEQTPIAPCATGNNFLTNPARHIIKPAGTKEDGDVGLPAGFIEPTVANLEFILRDLDVRKTDIAAAISGKKHEPVNDQAKNERQISSGLENEYATALNVAANFASIQEWMLKMGAYLMFGKDSVKSVSVNSGKNFFLHSHTEIMEEMESSKKISMSGYIIDQQEHAYIQVKYKSNPERKERMEMMRLLTPYRHLMLEQVVSMAGHLDVDKVELRINFTDVLDKFETKFSPIESFLKEDTKGEPISLQKRIETILSEFLTIIKRNNYGSIGSFESSIREENREEAAPSNERGRDKKSDRRSAKYSN